MLYNGNTKLNVIQMSKIVKDALTAVNVKALYITPLGTTTLYQAKFSDNSQYMICSTKYNCSLKIDNVPINFYELAYIALPGGLGIKNIKDGSKLLVPFQKNFTIGNMIAEKYMELSQGEHLPKSTPKNCYEYYSYTEHGGYEYGMAVELKPSEYIDFSF